MTAPYLQTFPADPMQQTRGPDWTCEEVIQLIQEYGRRPTLWDSEYRDYKNKFKKQQEWMELAAIFKCDKVEVERKMKILNSQYRRERIKALKLKKAGLPHKISWYGYRSFSFLNKNFKIKKTVNTVVKEEQNEEDFIESTDHDLYSKNEHEESVPQSHLVGSYVSENDMYNIEETKGSENMSHMNNTFNDNYNSNERDEWTVFGELVAHVLRKLPDERNRCMVKYKINTILYEAELSNFK